MTSEDSALKFGTIHVPYGCIIVVSMGQSPSSPIHYGGLGRPGAKPLKPKLKNRGSVGPETQKRIRAPVSK
jgi:hypothetical protein